MLYFLSPAYLFAAPIPEGIQTYHPNSHLSPEHKQKIADTLSKYRRADNIWDLLRDEFSLMHHESNPAVQKKIQWYMNNQDDLLQSASRAAPYLYYILQQVKKRHLPVELVLVPIVESGYNPFSQSNMGAAGIWQLMPQTALGYGIKQEWWYDGRRDVITSTRAALNYLAYLQSFFDGNWLLALAAYNTGEGNVMAAIRRNIQRGKATDFWSLPLAQQTRNYVPKLLALATIISHPDQYPVYLPPVKNAPYLAQIDTGQNINLTIAAALAGIPYKQLLQLNPGLKHGSTSPNGVYRLVLPIENIDQFTENLARTSTNRPIKWIHYRVKSGDTLASIAKQHQTSIPAISKLNHLNHKTTVRRGTNLLIPFNKINNIVNYDSASASTLTSNTSSTAIDKNQTNFASTNTASLNTQKALHYALLTGDTIYMIRKNDTLAEIAKRFKVSQSALKYANQLKNNRLTPGTTIIIPTHLNKQLAKKTISKNMIYLVKEGDTLNKIAKKFKLNTTQIRTANLLKNNQVIVGKPLIIPAHSDS